MIEIKFKKLSDKASSPFYATKGSAGVDLTSLIDKNIPLQPGERTIIPTGISVAIPDGMEAQIRPRSGLAFKHGITILNSPGTIDSDYRGEIKVIVINHGNEEFIIQTGMRIAQMVIAKYEKVTFSEVNNLSDTKRGESGFGSTGT